jgi:hypothetical protein
MFKDSERVIVEKKYKKIQAVQGSGVPVLNKGRKIPKETEFL